MRGVSRRTSHVALFLAVFLILGSSEAWAADAPPPTDPPQHRINPPVGVATQWRLNPPGGIAPPPPVPTPQVRPGSPGSVKLTDMILIWLQSRLSVPHG